jgi:hypothetical protein
MIAGNALVGIILPRYISPGHAVSAGESCSISETKNDEGQQLFESAGQTPPVTSSPSLEQPEQRVRWSTNIKT